jgi:hypothetical protein
MVHARKMMHAQKMGQTSKRLRQGYCLLGLGETLLGKIEIPHMAPEDTGCQSKSGDVLALESGLSLGCEGSCLCDITKRYRGCGDSDGGISSVHDDGAPQHLGMNGRLA